MLHVTNTALEIPALFSVLGLLYYFYKTWRTDPGYVKTSEEERREVSGAKGKGQPGAAQKYFWFIWLVCAALINLKTVQYLSFFPRAFRSQLFLLLLLVPLFSSSCHKYLDLILASPPCGLRKAFCLWSLCSPSGCGSSDCQGEQAAILTRCCRTSKCCLSSTCKGTVNRAAVLISVKSD